MNVGSENALEGQTIDLFASLGWQTTNAFYEIFTPRKAWSSMPGQGC